MGRGRAKAKQTKVARQLKYQNIDTDFAALERELGGNGDDGKADDHDAYDDEYGAYESYADSEYDEDDEPRRQAG